MFIFQDFMEANRCESHYSISKMESVSEAKKAKSFSLNVSEKGKKTIYQHISEVDRF